MKKATVKKVIPNFALFLWTQYKNNKAKRKRQAMRAEVVNYLETLPQKA